MPKALTTLRLKYILEPKMIIASPAAAKPEKRIGFSLISAICSVNKISHTAHRESDRRTSRNAKLDIQLLLSFRPSRSSCKEPCVTWHASVTSLPTTSACQANTCSKKQDKETAWLRNSNNQTGNKNSAAHIKISMKGDLPQFVEAT